MHEGHFRDVEKVREILEDWQSRSRRRWGRARNAWYLRTINRLVIACVRKWGDKGVRL